MKYRTTVLDEVAVQVFTAITIVTLHLAICLSAITVKKMYFMKRTVRTDQGQKMKDKRCSSRGVTIIYELSTRSINTKYQQYLEYRRESRRE